MPAFTLMGEQGSALLDSALVLPQQSAFGKEAYRSIFDKAAVLFRSLIRNHPHVKFFIQSFLMFGKEIEKGKVSEAFLTIFRAALKAAVRDLSAK